MGAGRDAAGDTTKPFSGHGWHVAFVLEVGPDVDIEELAALAQPVLDSVRLEALPPT